MSKFIKCDFCNEVFFYQDHHVCKSENIILKTDPRKMAKVLEEIEAERINQDTKWGGSKIILLLNI